ncbi:hypothetical protein GGR51DRAFT_499059 [Nemania sp. FL0031]|nr:hypothetical protein GGR51DRAFT_499059 [Nemania sp. FL0031]
MTSSKTSLENAPPCDLSWDSLVRRSLEAWGSRFRERRLEKGALESFASLDDFLGQTRRIPMFWFFQRREAFLSQETMTKWSRDRLDDYILLPATPGYVTEDDCFFVSHFWHARDNPDPGGNYLRLFQDELRSQTWLYVWVDWTCTPQAPRNEQEENYFKRSLQTMSGIIRNSGFIWHYPPFEPRLWILYEMAENCFTHDGGLAVTEDNREFGEHVVEMLKEGVRPTLEKYGYRCTYDRDQEFLTVWLESLVLLRKLKFSTDDIRRFQDQVTWHPSVQWVCIGTTKGAVELRRYEGTFIFGGKCYKLTPFPNWEDGKYSTNIKPGPRGDVSDE